MKEKILITGGLGQIGSELAAELSKIYGVENVIITDIKSAPEGMHNPYFQLDVTDEKRIEELIYFQEITQVYHLVALLSATAEKKPQLAWHINVDSLLTILRLASEGKVKKIFWPSSIAVFGPSTPKEKTPQKTITDPTTIYGISKLAGERWCAYYHAKFGVDVRSVRYPGLVSWKTKPGGGTTDYAVEIFYEALEKGNYQCFLQKDTQLPMLYMNDAVAGTIQLMEANPSKLTIIDSYNIAGLTFTPEELTQEIKLHLPHFSIDYQPDERQAYANSWPDSISDEFARNDWKWAPKYDLKLMVDEMLKHLKTKLNYSETI